MYTYMKLLFKFISIFNKYKSFSAWLTCVSGSEWAKVCVLGLGVGMGGGGTLKRFIISLYLNKIN